MSLITALGRQGQADSYEFEASVLYRVIRTARAATQRSPVSKNKQKIIRVQFPS